MWVYVPSDKVDGSWVVWTVGFYTPSGLWISESDHDSADEAAARVHYLNGGVEDRLARGVPVEIVSEQ